ncbi:MAG: hypothetical protein MK105_15485 [Crocinitomicaceae bacterium]|nr:hypothetical protein [Crocinitomicaceae bacterium]
MIRIIVLIFVSQISYGQSRDTLVIQKELNTALDLEDYQLASILKEELTLKRKIYNAISNEDYNKADSLQNLISSLYNEKLEQKPTRSIDSNEDKPMTSKGEYSDVPDLKTYDFFADSTGKKRRYGGLDLTSGYSLIDFDEHGFFVSLKWHFQWYGRNSLEKRNRFGIQLNHLQVGFSPLYPMLNIAPLNIGFTNVTRFSKKIGMEFNFTGGTTFNYDYTSWIVGFRGNPELKFRFTVFTFGLDAAYMWDFNDYHIINIGTSIGITL